MSMPVIIPENILNLTSIDMMGCIVLDVSRQGDERRSAWETFQLRAAALFLWSEWDELSEIWSSILS